MFLTLLEKIDLPRASDLPKGLMHQLIIAYVLITLPMLGMFPMWIPALALMTVSLKLGSMRWHVPISKWISFGLLVIFTALIIVNSRALGKEYTGVAMLFVFASLKILEAREQRDAFLLMLIYLLLIMGALMAQQSFFAFMYLMVCFLYNIYIQLRIAQPPELNLSMKHNLKAIAKISLASLPFVIILFFLFPRIDPLWQASGKPRAKTGLSDEMTPNSVSTLVQDGGMAFRVQFPDGRIPKNDMLYWRGPVLTDYDGETWRRSKTEYRLRKPSSVDAKSKIQYNIIHDGSTGKWLVPLDIPSIYPKDTAVNDNFELYAPNGISKPTKYTLTSYTTFNTGVLPKSMRLENTALPDDIFPRARQFAETMREQSRDDEDFANRLWQYFRDNEFYYDLEPPAGNADIDTFLFENRIGYCQHYASSFAFLLRSQGVPARVIAGYQGGELNNISKEFEVRQLHAHAWTEVYLPDKGWTRYDPTAAVSPERVNNGTPFGAAGNTNSIAASARWQNDSEMMRKLGASLRAMNSFWQNWVLNYDASQQQSLWQKLGLSAYKQVAWIVLLILLIPVVFLLLWWYRKRQAKHHGDSVYRAMQVFFRYVARQDLPVKPAETLHHWLTVNRDLLGESAPAAERVVKQYYQLRYQHSENELPSSHDSKRLRQAIAAFIRVNKRL